MSSKYLENYCRFCSDMFCCSKCRFKHEQRQHNLKIDCGICVYGKMHFKNVSDPLLNHLKTTHFPIHCLNCKQNFNEISELVENHKCTPIYDSPLNRNAESIIISGNMEAKFDENNSPLSMPPCVTLTTSTPVGSVMQGLRINTSSLNSINEHGNSIDEQSKKSVNRTSLDSIPTSKETNAQVPLVTPLRSIIVKGKLQNGFSESSNKRRVKFLKNIEYQSENKINDALYETEEILYLTPSENRTCIQNISDVEVLSLTPLTNETQLFYTPENCPHEDKTQYFKTKHFENASRTPNEEHSNGPLSSLGQMWTSMANAFKTVFLQVATPASTLTPSTSDNGSVKRHLSPTAGDAYQRIKRVCIRGRTPIRYTRLPNYEQNAK